MKRNVFPCTVQLFNLHFTKSTFLQKVNACLPPKLPEERKGTVINVTVKPASHFL